MVYVILFQQNQPLGRGRVALSEPVEEWLVAEKTHRDLGGAPAETRRASCLMQAFGWPRSEATQITKTKY